MSASAIQPTASIDPEEMQLLVEQNRHDPKQLAVLFKVIRAIRVTRSMDPEWYELSKLCQKYLELAERGGVQGCFNEYSERRYWAAR